MEKVKEKREIERGESDEREDGVKNDVRVLKSRIYISFRVSSKKINF